MNGTLSINGELNLLGELAVKIDEWYAGRLETAVESDSWGGWSVERMTVLLARLHPWQLRLVNFVAAAGGQRSDSEVRARFALGDSGLRGQTGAISKHVKSMEKAGIVPAGASHVLKVDRNGPTPNFIIPNDLVPIVLDTLAQPQIQNALKDAGESLDSEPIE